MDLRIVGRLRYASLQGDHHGEKYEMPHKTSVHAVRESVMLRSVVTTWFAAACLAVIAGGATAQTHSAPQLQPPPNVGAPPNSPPQPAYPHYPPAPNYPYYSAPPPNYPYPYPVPGYPYQPPPLPPPQTITVNLFSLGAGSIAADYERAVGSSVSLFVGPSFIYESATSGATTARMYGVGGDAGLRVFFGARAPEGGWFSLAGGVFHSRADFGNGDRGTATGSVGAALFGYTWIWGSGFVLSLGGGLAYVDFKLQTQESSVGLHGTLPTLRLALGYAF